MLQLDPDIFLTGRLSGGLSFWLPLNDAGAGAVNLSPARAVGSPTSTFTRATTATTFDVNATAPLLVGSGIARSYYDPVSHVYRGYLAEPQSTNLLLNSLINGTNLSTQSVTVTAQAYTLSFYGTGTVTLSGTFVGSLVGSAAYPVRSTLTFTPTAGTLTLTVSGTVQYAQLEAGSAATSFIPTAGVAVTRNGDVLTYPALGNILATSGAAYAEVAVNGILNGSNVVISAGNLGSTGIELYIPSLTTARISDVTNAATASGLTDASTGIRKRASSWGGSTISVCGDGATPATAAFDGDMNFAGAMGVGCQSNGGNSLNGTAKNVRVYMTPVAIQLLTT